MFGALRTMIWGRTDVPDEVAHSIREAKARIRRSSERIYKADSVVELERLDQASRNLLAATEEAIEMMRVRL